MIQQELKSSNFFIVFCKTRKKFDKYIKINKVKKKYIIDINKIIIEENININALTTSNILKVLIMKKINMAQEKKMDVYYIPTFHNDINIEKLLNIKELIQNTHNFNLMYFYEDFENNHKSQEILSKIDSFDISQILKDY